MAHLALPPPNLDFLSQHTASAGGDASLFVRRRGWPIGSGPVESACRQKQCRFRRPGQFWTPKGMRHSGALTEARHNHHWDDSWPAS